MSLSRQAKLAPRCEPVAVKHLRGVRRNARQQRFDRFMDAFKAARDQMGQVGQNETARRIAEIGDVKAAQRTVGRVAKGDSIPQVDTFFAILAANPDAENAFLGALSDGSDADAESAAWVRVGRSLAALMDLDDARRLVDALEDLAELGGLDTTWPHLRVAAHDRRAGTRREAPESRPARKSSA